MDKNQPRKTSLLGLFFNPGFGRALNPAREISRHFVQILAWVFASSDLFPRNHPAFFDGDARLSLSDVIAVAWQRLRFSKDNIPQILLFFGVVASLVFSALAVIVAVMSLFSGRAHAASYFEPEDPGHDIALSWLNYIFRGQTIYNYLDQYGQVIPQSTIVQGALITALGFYSNAILIVAAILLFYHLAAMVAETARDGVVMGKQADQLWAPIRLVVAIGLLVPIAGGLSSGQYIVIKMAEWGSGLASNVWSQFVHELVRESSRTVGATAPYARKTVYDTMMMEACMYTYNAYQNSSGMVGTGAYCSPYGAQPVAATGSASLVQTMQVYGPNTQPDRGELYRYDTQDRDFDQPSACGTYLFGPPPVTDPNDAIAASMANAVNSTRGTAFRMMQQNVRAYVADHMRYFIPECTGGNGSERVPVNDGGINQLIAGYISNLQSGIDNSAQRDFQANITQLADVSSSQGWVSAGAVFNTFARAQAAAMDTSGLVPATRPPQISSNASDSILARNVAPRLQAFAQWLNTQAPATSGLGGSSLPSERQQLVLAAAGFNGEAGDNSAHYMDNLFAMVDWLASWNHVWQSPFRTYDDIAHVGASVAPQDFTLGVQFRGANPLAEIAAFGHANINTAYNIFDLYVLFMIGGGSAQGHGQFVRGAAQAIPGNNLLSRGGRLLFGLGGTTENFSGEAANQAGSVLGIISVMFFTAGFIMAFILPLMPFLQFFFSVITWIIAVLEAVCCVPLIALAHLNPEGRHLPGKNGMTAYYFIFSIFLWPVMSVFGLIVALLVFFVAVSYMNMLYMVAVVGSGGISHHHVTLARIAYTILYVATCYMAANSCFRLVHWLPEHAIKWMGGQPMQFRQMGDPSSIVQPVSIAAGYIDSKIVGGIGPALTGLGRVQGAARAATGELTGTELAGMAGRAMGEMVETGSSQSRPSVDQLFGPLALRAREALEGTQEHPTSGSNSQGRTGTTPRASTPGTAPPVEPPAHAPAPGAAPPVEPPAAPTPGAARPVEPPAHAPAPGATPPTAGR